MLREEGSEERRINTCVLGTSDNAWNRSLGRTALSCLASVSPAHGYQQQPAPGCCLQTHRSSRRTHLLPAKAPLTARAMSNPDKLHHPSSLRTDPCRGWAGAVPGVCGTGVCGTGCSWYRAPAACACRVRAATFRLGAT